MKYSRLINTVENFYKKSIWSLFLTKTAAGENDDGIPDNLPEYGDEDEGEDPFAFMEGIGEEPVAPKTLVEQAIEVTSNPAVQAAKNERAIDSIVNKLSEMNIVYNVIKSAENLTNKTNEITSALTALKRALDQANEFGAIFEEINDVNKEPIPLYQKNEIFNSKIDELNNLGYNFLEQHKIILENMNTFSGIRDDLTNKVIRIDVEQLSDEEEEEMNEAFEPVFRSMPIDAAILDAAAKMNGIVYDGLEVIYGSREINIEELRSSTFGGVTEADTEEKQDKEATKFKEEQVKRWRAGEEVRKKEKKDARRKKTDALKQIKERELAEGKQPVPASKVDRDLLKALMGRFYKYQEQLDRNAKRARDKYREDSANPTLVKLRKILTARKSAKHRQFDKRLLEQNILLEAAKRRGDTEAIETIMAKIEQIQESARNDARLQQAATKATAEGKGVISVITETGEEKRVSDFNLTKWDAPQGWPKHLNHALSNSRSELKKKIKAAIRKAMAEGHIPLPDTNEKSTPIELITKEMEGKTKEYLSSYEEEWARGDDTPQEGRLSTRHQKELFKFQQKLVDAYNKGTSESMLEVRNSILRYNRGFTYSTKFAAFVVTEYTPYMIKDGIGSKIETNQKLSEEDRRKVISVYSQLVSLDSERSQVETQTIGEETITLQLSKILSNYKTVMYEIISRLQQVLNRYGLPTG